MVVEERRAISVRPAEAARMVGMSERKMRQLIADGRIESVLVDRSRHIPIAALERFFGSAGHGAGCGGH